MPPPIEIARFDALRKLAVEHFGPITPAEEQVLRLSASSQGPTSSESKDRPEVRADFLRWIVTDKEAANHIDPFGLRIENATVTSAIRLEFCKFPFPLTLAYCTLKEVFFLKWAELTTLYLLNCKAEQGISAEGLTTQGHVFLSNLQAGGRIHLLEAQVGGNLECSGANLTAEDSALLADRANGEGFALLADRARIAGGVVLERLVAKGEISFSGAQIGAEIDRSGATLTAKGNGCALRMDEAKITHGVHLSGKFSSSGEISLSGAQIGGDLDCSGAILTAKGNAHPGYGTEDEGFALFADGATISGDAVLEKLKAKGEIRFPGTQIEGVLDCSDAILTAKGVTLRLDEAKISGTTYLSGKFSSSGKISFIGTKIGGAFDCSGATLIAGCAALPVDGTAECVALLADRAEITGGVFLIKNFSSSGAIRLLGTQIGSDFNCSGANLTSKENSLHADGARIAGTVYLLGGFSSDGTIRLPDVQIDGSLDCRRAKLTAKENTLYADGAKIGHAVLLSKDFTSSATVRFNAAKIGEDFDCSGATIRNLECKGAQVAGNLNCSGASIGNLECTGTQPKGDLDCSGATIGKLECMGAQAGGDLIWTGIQPPNGAILNLSNSTFARLRDDRPSWPKKGNLTLDGFVYRDLVLCEQATQGTVVQNRVCWLERQPESELIKPQPWLQLAKMLEARGDPDGAKRVIYEFRRQQDYAANLLWRGATWLFDRLEEQPLRILYPIVLLWLFGFLIFWRARRMNAMCPRDTDAFNEFNASRPLPDQYTPFNAAMYALENVLPVVKLGQDDAWGPNPQKEQARRFPNHRWLAWTRWLPGLNYPWLATVRWTLIILGWALALILAAAIGERFKP